MTYGFWGAGIIDVNDHIRSHNFILLKTPLCIETSFSLSIYPLLGTWADPIIWLCTYCWDEHRYSGISTGSNLDFGVEPDALWLGHIVSLFIIAWKTSMLICLVARFVYMPTISMLRVSPPLPLARICCSWFLLLFLFFGGTGISTQDLMLAGQVLYLSLEPLHQPFLVLSFFEIGSRNLFAPVWLQTSILLISASWVARMTGVRDQ
jgi:hypothetical protein